MGGIAYTPNEARRISDCLLAEGIRHQVIKAQILSGDRKKAGGIKMANDPSEVEKEVRSMLG